ncbi:uncharacterized protein [Branchiostoma lanceolatum]|uniref:uncharacterized protein n=1 Tax=Branchiostoma lanceolatum TaxID=7740 RepID=UPI003456ABF5
MARSLLLLLVITVGCSVCLVRCVPAPGSRSRENVHMAKLLLRDLNMDNDDRHKLFEDVRTQNGYETSSYLNNKIQAPLHMSRRQYDRPEMSIGLAVRILSDIVRYREESLAREAALEANEDDLEELGKRRFN